MTLDWTALGKALRESAIDAHHGTLVPVEWAYEFLLENPECFLHVMPMELAMSAVFQADPEWPADMPQEPNSELIAAYYDSGASPTPDQGTQPGTGSKEKEHQS